MRFKFTFLAALLLLTAFAFAAGPSIHPVVTPTRICQGDTVTVAILTSDTFASSNVFKVQLSDSAGAFTHPVVVDSVQSQGNDTITFVAPAVAKNSAHYKIRVVASNNTIGLDSVALVIHNTPVVNFNLPQPSYCTYAYTVPLTGGSPTGGTYSGNFVSASSFQAFQSGTGAFDVYYTYTDSVGCFATDTTTINIVANCPTPSVSVTVNPQTLCPNSTMNVIIQTSDVIGSDNVFTVQLSDSTGSFASPLVLTTVNASSNDTLTVATPDEPAGTHYKVRVLASDPSISGVPFNVAFRQLLAAPIVNLNNNGPLSLCTKDSFKLRVDSVRGLTYQWTFNGRNINASHYGFTAKDSGLYIVHVTDTTVAGCSSKSDSIFIGIYPYPAKPAISAPAVINFCGTGTVPLSTTANPAVTFQWLNHGAVIAGATQTSYVTTVTGIYLVEAISTHGCIAKSDSVRVNIHPNPAVTLDFGLDTFCLHGRTTIPLSGGSPTGSGGFYTGNYVTGVNTFNQSSSGTGSFKVYYTFIDSVGCRGTDSATLRVYDCTFTAINEVSNDRSFDMYPNPAQGQVNIHMGEAANYVMHVTNLLGQEVSSQEFNQQLTFTTNKLAAGVYLVSISDAANTFKSVKRLIVQ